MSRAGIDFVLFDLGGVLVDVGGVSAMRTLAGIESDEELWERWLTSPWVRHFERGRCSPEEFATGMVTEWGLPATPDDFLSAFAEWPRGPLPGAAELVGDVRRAVPTACLSNTNVVHWETRFCEWEIFEMFDYHFASHEMGMVKPDRMVFDWVLGSLATSGDRILFLDDNRLNTDGAAQAGLVTHLVRGVHEARRALVEAGVLDEAPS